MKVDPNNVPVPHRNLGTGPLEGAIYFVTTFDPLRTKKLSVRTGKPIYSRARRTWGWFATFEEAAAIVQGNVTDLHELSYEYAMVEEIASGISVSQTREWWWRWDDVEQTWIAATRPGDYGNAIGLTLG